MFCDKYLPSLCSFFAIYALKQIVEVVLRQGLVHPMTSVPYLIALENDPEETNSKLAHQLLMNMNEKYDIEIINAISTRFS